MTNWIGTPGKDSIAIAGPRPWVDVRAYGAVGDGVTDDTVAIQAAANAIPATGGILELSAGTFRISGNITLKNNTWVRGGGRGAAIIKAHASLPTNAKMLTGTNLDKVTLSDFDIDMNGQVVWGAISFDTGCTYTTVRDIRVLNGIDGGPNTCMVVFYGASHILIDGCYFNNVRKLTVQGGAIIKIVNNTIITTFESGIQIPGPVGGPTDLTIAGNFVYNSHFGIDFANAQTFLIEGNEINTCDAGIYGEAVVGFAPPSTGLITNNLVFDSSNVGIYLYGDGTSTTDGVVIAGNRVHSFGGGRVGIAVLRGTRIVVNDNIITDMPLDGIVLGNVSLSQVKNNIINNCSPSLSQSSVTTSTISGNSGYITENSGATSIADGGTISHGLAATPTKVRVTPTVAGEMASVTALGPTTFTVALKTHAGAGGTTQTVYWEAEV